MQRTVMSVAAVLGLAAILAGCTGSGEWPGKPTFVGNGAFTGIGRERVDHDEISVLCSGDPDLPTMTMTGRGWTAVTTQPHAQGGPADIEITGPEGTTATITVENANSFIWKAYHSIDGSTDRLKVEGVEWMLYTNGLTCAQ